MTLIILYLFFCMVYIKTWFLKIYTISIQFILKKSGVTLCKRAHGSCRLSCKRTSVRVLWLALISLHCCALALFVEVGRVGQGCTVQYLVARPWMSCAWGNVRSILLGGCYLIDTMAQRMDREADKRRRSRGI
jgi:hypothetical protein